jgi:dolichyl-phosphate-mannose--protein O-mannosyl transferase
LGLLLVLAVAAFTRLDGLGTPNTYIADEGFYAPDGCLYVLGNHAKCQRSVEASPEHPPLGKWLIGLGIKATSYTPAGWRTAPALAGIATVAVVFVLALQLFDSVGYAVLAGMLLALEPLHIVQSRIATLDVFVTAFGTAAVLFAVLDYQRASPRLLPAWRLAAGVAGGCAVASKWSGVLALAAAATLAFLAPRIGVVRRLVSIGLAFGVLPLAVYVATFAGRVHGRLFAAPWAHGSLIRELAHRQLSMWRAQTGAFIPSTYESPPWSWPLLKRAEVHYVAVSHGQIREVLAVGSPIVWWLGFAAFAGALWRIYRRQFGLPELVIAVSVGFTYLPWLVVAHGRSFVFLYYMTPVVPFLCLAVAWIAWLLRTRVPSLTVVVPVAALLLIVFWWPVLTANPISYGAWRTRVVFHSCRAADQPDRLPTNTPGHPRAWLQVLHGRPPSGWCWV